MPENTRKKHALTPEMEERIWKPGVSGNPGGRPKKKPITDRYEALLEQALPDELRLALKLQTGATYGDAIVLGQARSALKGKTDAAKEIADRVEGKVTEQVELSGGAQITIGGYSPWPEEKK